MIYTKKLLNDIYGDKIICREGTSNKKPIEYNLEKTIGINKAQLAAYLHTEYKMAVIWSLDYRKSVGGSIKNLSLNEKWEKITTEKETIQTYYKEVRSKTATFYEKVIVLSFDVLRENVESLPFFMLFDKNDANFPTSLQHEIDSDEYIPEVVREKLSTSAWKRKYDFRKKVLEKYQYQCAVCRCTEEKILEAAHINPVYLHGSDETDNGICLCRNHHRMFDEKIIQIDFEKGELSVVKESVKNMAWFIEFQKKYKGKIHQP